MGWGWGQIRSAKWLPVGPDQHVIPIRGQIEFSPGAAGAQRPTHSGVRPSAIARPASLKSSDSRQRICARPPRRSCRLDRGTRRRRSHAAPRGWPAVVGRRDARRARLSPTIRGSRRWRPCLAGSRSASRSTPLCCSRRRLGSRPHRGRAGAQPGLAVHRGPRSSAGPPPPTCTATPALRRPWRRPPGPGHPVISWLLNLTGSLLVAAVTRAVRGCPVGVQVPAVIRWRSAGRSRRPRRLTPVPCQLSLGRPP